MNYAEAVLKEDEQEILWLAYIAQLDGNNRAARFFRDAASSISRARVVVRGVL